MSDLKKDMSNGQNKQSERVPRLRFPGFYGEWEEKKLGEIAQKVNEKNKTNKVTVVFSNSAVHGIVLQNEYFDKDIANKNNLIGYYIVKPFDFVYNPRISSNAEVGAMSINKTGMTGLVSPLYSVFTINNNQTNVSFLEFLFKSKVWHNYMRSIANYGARDDRMNIKNDDLFGLPILMPIFQEQNKIAAFLSSIDKRITTQNKIIENLKVQMSSLQEKIFSQEIRFKNQNDESFSKWEVRKLDEVLIKNSLKNKSQKYSTVQSVSNKHGFINQEEIFEERRVASIDTSNYYIIKKGYFAYNPSRINVGSLAYKKDDETSLISPLYISFKANNDLLRDNFLWFWFKTLEFVKQMNNSFEGSVRNTLNYENLIQMNISIPSLEEQDRLTNFLSSIDAKIESENQLLEKLESQKKYLLANLFI